jgi:hypothetical protein
MRPEALLQYSSIQATIATNVSDKRMRKIVSPAKANPPPETLKGSVPSGPECFCLLL